MADIAPIYEYAKLILGTDHTGHGFDHVKRVAAMAKQIIAEDQLQVDDYVVEAAAFLHDTIDDKVVKDVVKAKEEVQQCLLAAGATAEQISHIFTIIENLSFSKELLAGAQVSSLEGQIVKDADRLDALGAIGILRTSYFGGAHQHPIHESERAPKTFTNHADYRKGITVINHFYEKLFLLPEKMHTHFGKQEALRRKDVMTTFLTEFYREWDV
ncbi:HD domain-containing protein [Enterococcus gallinarum]|nr:HD domain-containing protein [Enterococcus gallinarum]